MRGSVVFFVRALNWCLDLQTDDLESVSVRYPRLGV